MSAKSMQDLYEYALSFFGYPYIWGGDGQDRYQNGYDCSGLVQKILGLAGVDPDGDQTAHSLYEHFLNNGTNTQGLGSLAFFGTKERIIHVGFCLDNKIMINASGGGSHCRTAIDAKRLNASVKIEPIAWRKNLVAVIMPRYLEKGIV